MRPPWRRRIGIFFAAVFVMVMAWPVAVLRADEPTTQPAAKGEQPAASQPAADKDKPDESSQPPRL